MSEAIELIAKVRKDIGKGASRRLRRTEQVPAIIYGAKKAPESIEIEARIVKRALEKETFYSQVIGLIVDDKKPQQVILKDIQRHPAKGHALHLDFFRISASQELTTNIPFRFINEESCLGVKAGGKISHNMNEVEIKCLPKNLPEHIEVDVASLEIGSTIHLTDIKVPETIQITQLLLGESHDLSVVTVTAPKQEVEEKAVDEEESETKNTEENGKQE